MVKKDKNQERSTLPRKLPVLIKISLLLAIEKEHLFFQAFFTSWVLSQNALIRKFYEAAIHSSLPGSEPSFLLSKFGLESPRSRKLLSVKYVHPLYSEMFKAYDVTKRK